MAPLCSDGIRPERTSDDLPQPGSDDGEKSIETETAQEVVAPFRPKKR
jgi:hypothetical protein